MTRAVSTVLDASLAVLLVSAAAVALVAIPVEDPRPPDPDATARTVLASTASGTYDVGDGGRRTVSGRVGTLLGHAVVARDRGTDEKFVGAVRAGVRDVLAATDDRVAVIATAGDARIRVGKRAPPGASVAAVTHRVAVDNRSARVTVRTWSR